MIDDKRIIIIIYLTYSKQTLLRNVYSLKMLFLKNVYMLFRKNVILYTKLSENAGQGICFKPKYFIDNESCFVHVNYIKYAQKCVMYL